jgi:hypothetical protein
MNKIETGAVMADDTMWNGLLHLWSPGSFLKSPHVLPQKQLLLEAGANVAVLGFPWDATSVFRTGAKRAFVSPLTIPNSPLT